MNETLERQLRAVFREEASEVLGELRDVVSALRGASAAELEVQISLAMRLAHNLKGSASSVGLFAVEGAAHAMEDALLHLRTAGTAAREQILELFSAAIHAIEAAAEGQGDEAALQSEARLLAWVREEAGAPEAPQPARPRTDPVRAGLAEPRPDPHPAEPPSTDKSRTVRIETARLDALLQFASELIIAGTDMRQRHEQLEALRRSLHDEGGAKRDTPALRMLDRMIQDDRRAVNEFTRLSGNLHESMRRARMVRLDSQVSALRRTVDDAARSVDKAVDLETDFSNVELDKAVLDRLRDPIVHLLRNAIDHGLESAEVRAMYGKSERGLVRFSARVTGSMVELSICDDGAGIDLRRVAATAVARGLLSPAQAEQASDAELLDAIFAEGFSTRDQATRLSGRGIGLDVVQRALKELGGSVRALARGPLGGAAFVLTVPLSLLAAHLLLVQCNDCVYALPVQAVERVVNVPKTALQVVDGAQVVQIGESEVLRLRWLSQLVSSRAPRDSVQLKLVVVAHGGVKLALAVDEILHEAALIVRKLPWNLLDVPAVSGAAVLADGSAAIVMDAAELATRHKLAAAPRKSRDQEGGAKILVVDDSMTTRTLHRNVLSFAGYDVVVAHDGREAWELLRNEAVDAVVSDVQMPVMDGLELTRHIRADARLQGICVVLVTSLAGPDDVRRGREAGADEYVIKGALERDALLAAVAKHVS